MRKQYIEVPIPMSCSFFYKLWIYLKGTLLSPFYLIAAHIAGAPGIRFYLRIITTLTKLLLTGSVSIKTWYSNLLFPMDSTRYFEFHEVWKRAKDFPFTHYLDISSPRLMPLLLLKTSLESTGEFINPDSSDLKETEKLAKALGLKSRCKFTDDILENIGFSSASFDLVTCISVLEHIPEDKAALKTMWSLIQPGGKLILTLPCMFQSLEQYISYNQYGVLNPGDDGYTFWQHYYDRERLESCIYSVTGKPTYISVYGEKRRGLFFRNTSMKRLLGSRYPFWREAYMMATEYKLFSSTDELPGEGVVMLEFIKPEELK